MKLVSTFSDYVASQSFFETTEKEFFVDLHEDLIEAIDNPQYLYYILQGSWGVGKSSLLKLLHGLLTEYIKTNAIKDLVVIYIDKTTGEYSDKLIDKVEPYKTSENEPTRRTIHKLLQREDLRKILLVDLWASDKYQSLYAFTRPINPTSQNYKRTTQIVAGSGSWKFNVFEEHLVNRILVADSLQKPRFWTLVHISPLTKDQTSD